LHRGADALHTFEGVANGAVALFGSVEGAARGFGMETVSSSTALEVLVIS
jgi:hypothetical protein